MPSDRTTQIQRCLDRLAAGELEARDELIAHTQQRLRTLAHGLLARDRVHRWEQTDDLLQQALLRIHEELQHVQPATVAQFLRFGAFHLRRELMRLARRHFGPEGQGAHHASDGLRRSRGQAQLAADPATQPLAACSKAEELQRLSEAIEALPAELQEMIEMMWLQGLSRAETAEALGVDVRTVHRRWIRARLKLAQALDGHEQLPRSARNRA